jgi:hypothetical protein
MKAKQRFLTIGGAMLIANGVIRPLLELAYGVESNRSLLHS